MLCDFVITCTGTIRYCCGAYLAVWWAGTRKRMSAAAAVTFFNAVGKNVLNNKSLISDMHVCNLYYQNPSCIWLAICHWLFKGSCCTLASHKLFIHCAKQIFCSSRRSPQCASVCNFMYWYSYCSVFQITLVREVSQSTMGVACRNIYSSRDGTSAVIVDEVSQWMTSTLTKYCYSTVLRFAGSQQKLSWFGSERWSYPGSEWDWGTKCRTSRRHICRSELQTVGVVGSQAESWPGWWG